jgi:hypothetical protein
MRGEFVGLTMKLFSFRTDSCPSFDSDLHENDWYTKYMQCAYASGIISGKRIQHGTTTKVLLNPTAFINTQEALQIMTSTAMMLVRSYIAQVSSIFVALL